MFKKISIFLLVFFVFSCGIFTNDAVHGRSIDFEIVNTSSEDIQDIEISLAYDSGIRTGLTSLGTADTVQTTLDMSAAAEVDGSYVIRYTVGDVRYEKKFGYYSQGNPISKRMYIKIENTGIQIESLD